MATETTGNRGKSLTSQKSCLRPDEPTQATIAADFASDAAKAIPAPESHQLALPSGYLLHEYEIRSVLGSGGFGITYLAFDTHLHQLVAIKEFLPGGAAIRLGGATVCPINSESEAEYARGITRFVAEARVLAGFKHPGIVRVTRFFETNGTAYMVMDYEKGLPLREWIKNRGDLDEASLIAMFSPLLDGLATVHRGGITHRDIKPANIYVRASDASLVLLDFGAARSIEGEPSRSVTSMVTPGYAPLEQYHSRGAQGPWSDIYALGGVLYWLVTGQKPVEAPARVNEDPMTPAARLAEGRFSQRFLRAIDWALAPDDSLRPRQISEFRAALIGEVLPGRIPGEEATERAVERELPEHAGHKLNRAVVWAGGVAIVVIAVVLWVGLGLQTDPGKSAPPGASAESSASAPAEKSVALPSPSPSVLLSLPPLVAPAAEPPARDESRRENPGDTGTNSRKLPEATRKTGDSARKSQTPADSRPTEALAATLIFEVVPSGEIYVDGRKVGVAPPLQRLPVSPGRHVIEVRGSLPPGVYHYSVNVSAGDQQRVVARFSPQVY